jgi:PAS domain S-box-containing protein/putative nucleotidyltransferase with HDIG domain
MIQPDKTTILTIDDDESVRSSIAAYLEDSGFNVLQACNGLEGMELFRREHPDLALLDLRMPEMDGIEVLGLMLKEQPDIPIIVVSGMGTMKDVIDTLRLGAWDYLTKPIMDMGLMEHAVNKSLERAELLHEHKRYQERLEEAIQERTKQLKASEKKYQDLYDNAPDMFGSVDAETTKILHCNQTLATKLGYSKQEIIGQSIFDIYHPDCMEEVKKACDIFVATGEVQNEELQLKRKDGSKIDVSLNVTSVRDKDGHILHSRSAWRDITERKLAEKTIHNGLTKTVEAVVKALEARDPYTAGHQRRVAKLAVAIARELGWESNRIEGLRFGAMIHDIGKINTPAEMLVKPSKLNDIEYSLIQGHSQVGYDILKDIEFPWPIADITHQHHERLDGSGYPQGLKGDEICMEVRIVAVADVVEAMSSHRPYRPALGMDAALNEVKNQSGKLFDSKVVGACLKICTEDNFDFE